MKLFKILKSDYYHYTDEVKTLYENIPSNIAFEIVEPHRNRALLNHGGQTLERLNERGGLCPFELYFVLNDKKFDYVDFYKEDFKIKALNYVKNIIDEWNKNNEKL